MSQGKLSVYKASAGSGKTYCLTREYLQRLFAVRGNHNRILAVTFTNKASTDMKMKIISQLNAISSSQQSSMANHLSQLTGKDESRIAKDAGDLMFNILHDYSGFYVGTIDSFFQRILRAFTREIGLQQGYMIELDHSLILSEAVDSTLRSSAGNTDLTRWLTDYINSRTEEGKSWNLRKDIIALSREIFSEKFRMLSAAEREFLRDREAMNSYISELKKIRSGFTGYIRNSVQSYKSITGQYNVTDEMFLRGSRGGVPSFINSLSDDHQGTYKPLNATVSMILDNPPVFSSKNGPAPPLAEALSNGLDKVLTELLTFYNNNFRYVNTAVLILENIYILGILADILDNVHMITASENKFLISDTGELLFLIIGNDQTPFIYEKTGNAFDHFMIDEFQDTSHIQWNNFKPLIMNSLAEGKENLVVGDVKQSIYRWRNSDWTILGYELESEIDSGLIRNEELDTNWRSDPAIIAFNNSVFSILPGLAGELIEAEDTRFLSVNELYRNASQHLPDGRETRGGLVKIEYIDNTDMEEFREKVLEKLPYLIEELNDKGYSGGQIGILVRTNSEGAEIVKRMLAYKAQSDNEKKSKYNYDLISNDSLLVSSSPAILLLIWTLRDITGPQDRYVRAHIIMFLNQCHPQEKVSVFDLLPAKDQDQHLPEGFHELRNITGSLSLFEIVEYLIKFYRLDSTPDFIPYLNALQDMVLEFSTSEIPDIKMFLDWWDNSGCKRYLSLPDDPRSMKVLTIHKAKGLEFPVVIIPFISWLLGHGSKGPVMWLRPGDEPFGRTGIVPVKYRSDLVNSSFADDYLREQNAAAVDNLNLLYVAFTRPVNALFGFAPLKTKSNSISSLLLKSLKSNISLNDGKPFIIPAGFYNVESNIFQYGELPWIVNHEEKDVSGKMQQIDYYINSNKQKFRIRFHGNELVEAGQIALESGIGFGKLLHKAFESIYDRDDAEPSLDNLLSEGLIDQPEKVRLLATIREALDDPLASGWFDKGIKVITEGAVLLPSGHLKRPDRIILLDDKTIIIDFKFGKENPSHTRQVREYMDILMSMGYKNCEAYIWYPLIKKRVAV